MKYENTLLKFITIFLICTKIHSEVYTRALSLQSKTVYKDNLEASVRNYFEKAITTESSFTAFPVSNGTGKTVTANDFKYIGKLVDTTDAKYTLDNNCAMNYELSKDIKLTFEGIDATYKDETSKETVDFKLNFGIIISGFKLNRKLQENLIDFVFDYEYTAVSSAGFTTTTESDIAKKAVEFLNSPAISTKVAGNITTSIRSYFSNGLNMLNAMNSLSLDLQVNTLTDNKSRKLITKNSVATDCTNDNIFQKFTASINNSDYPVEKSTDYELDATKSSQQVFYDITILDELIKSKVKEGIFEFFVDDSNAKEYNILGYTINDLANIFPSIKSKSEGNNSYSIHCTAANASMLFNTTLDKLVSRVELACEIIDNKSTLEKISTLFDITLSESDAEESSQVKHMFKFSAVDLVDYSLGSNEVFDSGLLTKTIVNLMDKYLQKNGFVFFKLDNDNGKGSFEFVKGKGLLFFEKKEEVEVEERKEMKFLDEREFN